jgi:hypothetical protein
MRQPSRSSDEMMKHYVYANIKFRKDPYNYCSYYESITYVKEFQENEGDKY